MKINLKNDKIPTYIGVYNSLYSDIVNGKYKKGEMLPGENALAGKYNVSRNTLRQALAILSEDDLIIKLQGKGTFISSNKEKKEKNNVENPLISKSKVNISGSNILYNYGCPTDIARDKLKLSTSDIVLACNSVYYSDDIVTGYSFTQIPSIYFNKFEINTGDESSIKEAVIKKLFIYTAKLSINLKLIYANEIEIEYLKVSLNTPLLMIEALHYSEDGVIVARNKFYFKPEFYNLDFLIS